MGNAAGYLDDLDKKKAAAAQSTADANAQRDKDASGAFLNPYAAAALSGATFGLGDEATAAARSTFGDTPYDIALAQERANLAKVRDEHPGYALGSELVGGLPWMLASRGATAPTTLARAGVRAGFEGGIWGGLTGFGEGEGGVGNRAQGAGEGASGGALLAGPMGMLLHGSMPFLKLFSREDPAAAGAESKIVENVERQPGGLAGARQAVTDYNASEADRVANSIPSPRRTLAEVLGDQTRSGLDAVLQQPGEGASAVRTALTARQGDRLNRVGDAITSTFGDADPAYLQRQQLYKQRSADAGPLYQKAFDNAGDLTTQDYALLKRVPAEAFTDAKKIAQAEGRSLTFNPEFDKDGALILRDGQQLPTAQDMHYVKVGIQNTIDKNTGLDQKVNTYGGRLIGLRDDVEGRLNDLTRDPSTGESLYQKASAAWADPSARMRAMELGQKATTLSPEELQASLDKMSQGEKDSFVTGYMQQLRDKLAKAPDIGTANPVRQIFATPQQRRVAEIAMSALGLTPEQAQARFGRLADYMEHETAGAGAETQLLRGSQTATRQAWMGDTARSAAVGAVSGAAAGIPAMIVHGPTLTGLATAGLTAATGATAATIAAARKAASDRLAEGINNNMARMLGGTDPAAQEQTMRALAERAAQMRLDAQRRAAIAVAGRAAAVPTGEAGGRNADDVRNRIWPPTQ